jgi:hypothetical protein
MSHEFADLIREGCSQESLYGDEGEWTKDHRIEARAWYFWGLDRFYAPRNFELPMRLVYELHDNQYACHEKVACTLAKAIGRFWLKQIRQNVKEVFERCVVCRQAKIQPQMAATLYLLLVPPIPWRRVRLDILKHLLVTNGFDRVLIVVDHLTRLAHFLPCKKAYQ